MLKYLAKKSTKYIIYAVFEYFCWCIRRVSLKESYVILQIPGSFAEGEEINGCVHKKVNILK